ncbi:L,D-transpeptidase [Alkaliphilus serpentinus]|uniref:Murein L,D-transpeptidase n=1 Tax=Alkaliphilus serpentinus TaxID=1482731 RepID=A0A833HR34_9FIRM|nr:L,D-transpeptidase [Alkaliphilus serpentinus]KAB3532839.1 murein L,D-transpeptidase [Alkaliphilus serpentinus]
MYKKISLIIMALILITAMACSPRERPNPQGEQPNEDLPKDRLAKSKKEAVEENINGYNLEDDLRISDIIKEPEEHRVLLISEKEKMQVLERVKPKKINTVLEEYKSDLPNEITEVVQYTQYEISFDYFLITAENGAKILEKPKPNSTLVAQGEELEKVSLLQRVEGEEINGSKIWYRVAFKNGNGIKEGYISSTDGTPRSFRFDKMQNAINELKQQLAEGELHFISNYKNENGAPPSKGDAAVDEHGYRVYHSAPAYQEADENSDFRYIPDGMLVRILNETGDYYHIYSPTFDGNYYVPKRYIDPEKKLDKLKDVIVVDRSQQNQAAFEVVDNGLNLISYTLSTTGIKGDFSFVTTLGSYKAIVKRDRFEYLKSGTQEIAGYAPFAIRFTGGAYIHGVPVKYEEKDGEKVDPGVIEYLHTIGTFPRSSMCVRNYTSHAEFLYNWMDVEGGAFIIIE